ncbi:hypothetical protein Tco_1394496 [Tanacetum coccineum]
MGGRRHQHCDRLATVQQQISDSVTQFVLLEQSSQPQYFSQQPSHPQYFSQPSSQPQFKVPQAKEPREAKAGKQPVVDLDEDDEDDEMASSRSITRWNNNEEILLAESWIKHSQDANIGKDQQDDIYWNMILSDFNSRTTAPPRTKNMDAAEPIDEDNLQELFGPDPRERPAGKQRAPKKQKSVETTSARGSTRGSQSKSISSLVSQDHRRKCDAAEKAYDAKRQKELVIMQCKELEFLMIDPSSLPAAKRAIIERKQAEIMRKYPDA